VVVVVGMGMVRMTAACDRHLVVNSSVADGGVGTLSWAIHTANAMASADAMALLPAQTTCIGVADEGLGEVEVWRLLPTLEAANSVLDGGAARLRLRAPNSNTSSVPPVGLKVSCAGCLLRRIDVVGFPRGLLLLGDGVRVHDVRVYDSSAVGIELDNCNRCAIGPPLPAPGSATIDGSATAAWVVVAGCRVGIRVLATSAKVSIARALVGLDDSGLAAYTNSRSSVPMLKGILVHGRGATVGGPRSSHGCVIAAQQEEGIRVEVEGDNATLQGNLLGLASDGATRVGIHFGAHCAGKHTLVGGRNPTLGNVFSAAADSGLVLSGSHQTVIGNIFGLDATGRLARRNIEDGLEITEAHRTGAEGVGQPQRPPTHNRLHGDEQHWR
jgi:hypothetical protein